MRNYSQICKHGSIKSCNPKRNVRGYKRTGQLRDSPQLDGINYSGDSAQGQISINTGTQYSPSGRDTATIYGYAEAGGLLGNGGFWERTEEQIQDNIDESFGKRFE